jgi:hypothetical protein
MKNSLGLGVVVAAIVGAGAARAQAPLFGNNAATNAPIATAPAAGLTFPTNGSAAPGAPAPQRPGGPEQVAPGLTDYLTYLRPAGCCGPIGGDGPIGFEIFVRPGVSFPTGGSFLARVLDPGFMIQGGARTLFFTPRHDLAWTIELGITTAWWDVHKDEVAVLRNVTRNIPPGRFTPAVQDVIPELPVIPSSLNETYVHLALGHEIYVCGDASCADPDPKWRLGYDLGGRWGSSKLIVVKQRFPEDRGNPNLGLFRHLTDVVGGVFVGLHTDIEVPYKCAMIFAGVRTEIAYIWADLLQPQNNTDLMMINLLFNAGIRF